MDFKKPFRRARFLSPVSRSDSSSQTLRFVRIASKIHPNSPRHSHPDEAAVAWGEMKSLQCFKQSSGGGGNGCAPGKRLERRLSLGEYKKAVSWSKYLIAPPGARIRGGGEELWSADLSKLEIRGKFASGRHSRVYSGRYAGREVAIKMVSQPEEDAALATELERQFASEVALLLRLHHPNIISV